MANRVAVSGIGMITPLGLGKEVTWRRLLAGHSAFAPVETFDTSAYPVHLGAEVREFDPASFLHVLEPSSIGRASQMAVAAALLALADASLDSSQLDPIRVGVAMGTTSGEPREVERFNDYAAADGMGVEEPALATRYPCHTIGASVAAELGIEGASTTLPNACAAGSYAIGWASDEIAAGRADVVLAGGSDAFSRITYAGFARLGAIAADTCRPFDRRRSGMIPGEGAAVLVLESLDHALRRGAELHAEIVGFGLTCDAHHMTAAHPEGDGAVRAMSAALEDAGLKPDDVDYISAHGTGTPTNDRVESLAVLRVFGERGARVPMSSVKSMLGHTMGAASAIETGVCCLAISSGRIPPTAHFEEADPLCPIDCVPNEAREVAVDVAMNNAYAFGGTNASLLLRRCHP
ncbi:MAG TPA: beta-ketoacyl-[acyl-carrier-protein] synthase family protein [Thermoanaerobaculia bacterium]|nr:beta-ketoacyl-[acyl-carrier-protein] synthase family protein [Thermoanaerobaculia bacterium]